MSPAQIERTKLLATPLNTMATSCFTVGIATPVAGYVYNIRNFRSVIDVGALAGGMTGWIVALLGLHLVARRVLLSLDR
ncbi:MAG: hypothetical protein JO048_10425 [Methylobacteriaceae bacterium]|nr:hypothetical protein [Methylobacteriaceae bacterium]